MKYGYARVSTDGQSVDAQVRQLTRAGCTKVFRETASGAKTDRAQLRRALAQLDAGDVLVVTRLDRLARSTRDLLNTLAAITDRRAGFRSLSDAWADTTTAHGRLMLTVLGGLAEFERELIRARTSEGRARAKANGKSLGRPFKLTEHQGAEGPSARKRTVRNENTDKIPGISVQMRWLRSDAIMNCRFIACNHGVQSTLDAESQFGPAYCTQQIGGLTRGIKLRAIRTANSEIGGEVRYKT